MILVFMTPVDIETIMLPPSGAGVPATRGDIKVRQYWHESI